MSWSKIYPGNVRKLTASFTDADLGGAIDPDAVYLTITQPGETAEQATTYQYGVDAEIVKDNVGEYHANIGFPASGMAYYRWWSTGDGQASTPQAIEIKATAAG